MRVAIVGATGVVGQECLALLQQRDFPVTALKVYASARSLGKTVDFAGHPLAVEVLPENGVLEAEVAFVSAGSSLSLAQAERWASHGTLVIDNSSAWRMHPDVPLVIPEVNPQDIAAHAGIIANPNCSTIIALLALAPLHKTFGLRRVVIATYQAVSGAGASAIQELERQSQAYLQGRRSAPEVFTHPIAFNLFSHDSAIDDEGLNTEERKLITESRKILHAESLRMSATCVRVPVFRAHSEAIHLACEHPVTVEAARELLQQAPGVRLVDDAVGNHFPMPLEASGRDEVLVGRIRKDSSTDNGLALFVVGDQIRKGAALNAVQIAEHALAMGLLSA